MRITTWNCYRGQPLEKVGALQHLEPDLVALQECGRPIDPDDRVLWVGDMERQGLALVGRDGLATEIGPQAPSSPTALPAVVKASVPFQVLVIWAHRNPTYPLDVQATLEGYRDFIATAPTIVLGDFNSSSVFDSKNRRFSDTDLVRFMANELGLVSAYHIATGEAYGQESQPTLYHQRKSYQPFHIDYCFVPKAMAAKVKSVEVGSYERFEGLCDHRPLTVDIDLG